MLRATSCRSVPSRRTATGAFDFEPKRPSRRFGAWRVRAAPVLTSDERRTAAPPGLLWTIGSGIVGTACMIVSGAVSKVVGRSIPPCYELDLHAYPACPSPPYPSHYWLQGQALAPALSFDFITVLAACVAIGGAVYSLASMLTKLQAGQDRAQEEQKRAQEEQKRAQEEQKRAQEEQRAGLHALSQQIQGLAQNQLAQRMDRMESGALMTAGFQRVMGAASPGGPSGLGGSGGLP
jgi:hypothetical protein